MWVLSVDAGTLLSVVQFEAKKAPAVAERHGATQQGVDYLLVRARHKPSLEYVCDVLDALRKGEAEGYVRPLIDTDKKADYHYRTVITRDEWKQYLMYEVDGIDYDSHVKEETVRRQPEPKIAHTELYKALSTTWSAWAALQPDRPYSGIPYYSPTPKPDCKHCSHRELNHKLTWSNTEKKNVYGGCFDSKCNCPGYEPKPVAWPLPDCVCGCKELRHKMRYEDGKRVYGSCNGNWDTNTSRTIPCPTKCQKYEPKTEPEPVKSAAESAAVFMAPPADETAPLKLDYSLEGEYDEVVAEVREDWASEMFIGPDGYAHPAWCCVFDGDSCICGEAEAQSLDELADDEEADELAALERLMAVEEAEEQRLIEAQAVDQEPARPNESKRQRKARQARNRRRRRAAQRGA